MPFLPFSLGIHLGFLSFCFLFFQYACTFLFDKASRPQLFVNFQGPTLAFTYLIWHSQWTMLCVCVCVCEPVKCNEQTQHDAVYEYVWIITCSPGLSTKRICPIITFINAREWAMCTMYRVHYGTVVLLYCCTVVLHAVHCVQTISIRMGDYSHYVQGVQVQAPYHLIPPRKSRHYD